MAKRYYKPSTAVLATPEASSVLPTDRPIAVYYRQSTDAQIGNISTSIQTIDMVAYLQDRGWPEQSVLLIDMDAGVSGTKKIDERPGMRKVFDMITQGQVGAVACQDEDRLFRDVTQIQVNIFIDACRTANVLVLTPSMVYDFANEYTGSFHARQFRFKSEMAAEYINTVIKGKLHRAKRRMQMEGRWAGSGIASGYMVDMRKTLPDGRKNEEWRRFVPFEPYAEAVKEYFLLFLAYGGNLTATLRHIHNHGPYYPDPKDCPPPEGYKFVPQMTRYEHGYCPGKSGLFELLTNALYIGHWSVQGAIVRWNNHEPIIPVDKFMRAYNYLMEYTLNGQPNPDYRPFRQHTRPTLEEDRAVSRPLCAGIMVTQLEGKWRNVGTNWVNELQQYKYILWSNNPLQSYVWGKEAGMVDEAVGALLREKLQATFDTEQWHRSLISFAETYVSERKSKQAQLTSLERVRQNLLASLETLSNAEMITAAQERYEIATQELTRLQSEIAFLDNETGRIAALTELKDSYLPALENWDQMTHEEQRVVFHTFIRRIEATNLGGKGLKLMMYWVDGSSDLLLVHRRAPTGETWLPTDIGRLLSLLDAHASQADLCAAFPHRTWNNIRNKIYRERGTGAFAYRENTIRGNETYADYTERTHKNAHMPAGSAERWPAGDTRLLLDLIDNKATDLEIAAAFPRRTWGGIRKKIKNLIGDTFYIRRSNKLRQDESIMMYRERVGQVQSLSEVNDGDCAPEINSDNRRLMDNPISASPIYNCRMPYLHMMLSLCKQAIQSILTTACAWKC